MSQANAAAIRRRANAQSNSASTTNTTQSNQPDTTSPRPATQPTTGLTLQQVINTFDNRINKLETDVQSIQTDAPTSNDELPSIIDEFNNRFVMIAEEIASMKDLIMKLQSFTMEVNKSLFDERIHILSDLGNSSIAASTIDNRSNHNTLSNNGEHSPTSIDLKNLANSELHENSKLPNK
jgi:preprotein translocase subunit SecD